MSAAIWLAVGGLTKTSKALLPFMSSKAVVASLGPATASNDFLVFSSYNLSPVKTHNLFLRFALP